MTHSGYRQCTRCVMDTSDPDIQFDAHGRCNHCREYFDRTSRLVYQGTGSEQKLTEIVDRIKRSGRASEYDCVLGISGGIDSCYAAWTLKRFGVRTLAVHLDNGWDSDTSVTNIRRVVSKLGFDYESYVLDWEEFRDLQVAFLRASVPEMETPTDMAIPAALHEVAARHNVKYIVSGGNFATEGILPKGWHYYAKDVTYLRAIHRRFGSRDLTTFPLLGYQREMYYKIGRGMRFVYILNYVPYSKKDAMQVLESELSWRYYGGKHHESRFTAFVQSYILPTKFNIDYRRATGSTQICAGEVSRAAVLAELCHKPYDEGRLREETDYFRKKLGIGIEEFYDLMHAPAKTYRDYPNDKTILELVYGLYRLSARWRSD